MKAKTRRVAISLRYMTVDPAKNELNVQPPKRWHPVDFPPRARRLTKSYFLTLAGALVGSVLDKETVEFPRDEQDTLTLDELHELILAEAKRMTGCSWSALTVDMVRVFVESFVLARGSLDLRPQHRKLYADRGLVQVGHFYRILFKAWKSFLKLKLSTMAFYTKSRGYFLVEEDYEKLRKSWTPARVATAIKYLNKVDKSKPDWLCL